MDNVKINFTATIIYFTRLGREITVFTLKLFRRMFLRFNVSYFLYNTDLVLNLIFILKKWYEKVMFRSSFIPSQWHTFRQSLLSRPAFMDTCNGVFECTVIATPFELIKYRPSTLPHRCLPTCPVMKGDISTLPSCTGHAIPSVLPPPYLWINDSTQLLLMNDNYS